MSLLRIIGAAVVFVFLGLFGFFVLLGKIISLIISALFSPAAKSPPPAPRRAAADHDSQSTARKGADSEVIEVEVVSIRKDEPNL